MGVWGSVSDHRGGWCVHVFICVCVYAQACLSVCVRVHLGQGNEQMGGKGEDRKSPEAEFSSLMHEL